MTPTNRSRRTAVLASLGALAVLATACSSSSGGGGTSTVTVTQSGSTGTSTAPASASPSATSSSAKPVKKVHLKTLNADGATYGVGMPVIVYFQHRVKSAVDFSAATKVTADGKPVTGAWYFEGSSANKGYPVEAHWRPKDYWPAHSKIHVDIPAKGVSGGGNFVFDNSLTLDFYIGKQNIGIVNDSGSPHTLTIRSDGKLYGTFPTSLGAPNTQTRSGIKVIMEQLPSVCMHDIAGTYYECGIKFSQRLTYDGEYLHSAPWNISNINSGVDSSNGCTNLLPSDAERLFNFLQIGDPIQYPNASGGKMQLGEGYGDWNVPWAVWQTGGLVRTT